MKTEREKDRERQIETDRERQKERQKQLDRETERQIETRRDKERQRETERDKDRQIYLLYFGLLSSPICFANKIQFFQTRISIFLYF